MKAKCPKCGFEDEGRFCSKCGSSLPEIRSLEKKETPKPPAGVSWFEKCPACKSSQLRETTEKKLLGLLTVRNFICNNCGATFTQHRDKYKLSKVQITSTPTWQSYGNQILTEKEWKNIAYGGMSDAKQKEADMELWMGKLKEGTIPIQIMGGEAPIIIKKDEELQLTLPSIVLREPRAVRQSSGGYGGPSFRVAKGLYFRVGAFGSTSESHEEMRDIDQGTFSLTNKRVVFSGSKRTIEIPLKKIISMEPYSDGIAIRRSGKEKTQYFIGVNCAGLTITVDDRIYKESLSGLILMHLIEGFAKREE
jgi:hypothetical protein